MKTYNLTKKQYALYAFCCVFLAEHKYFPTVREICKGMGYKSTGTVAMHLAVMCEKGIIKQTGHGGAYYFPNVEVVFEPIEVITK